MRTLVFSRRNMKEMLRDPLSYIFCLGFPIVLFLLFRLISRYAAGAYWFEVKSLTPGILMFSYSFVMLHMTLLVSKDRTTSFLMRLFSSPMTAVNYVAGYGLTGLGLALGQSAVCCAAAWIICAVSGGEFHWGGAALCILAMIPVMVIFIGLGILFGSLFSEKSAPGVSSVIISVCGVLGGAWMPLETMGGFEKLCRCLPFYPATMAGRTVFALSKAGFDNFWLNIIITAAYAAAAFALAAFAFKSRMKAK